MRIFLGGAAIAALAAGSMSVAVATQPIPHCSVKNGPVVWYLSAENVYYYKGWPRYGMGNGSYVCRATADARGGHPVNLNRGERHAQHHHVPSSPTPDASASGTMTMTPQPSPSP